MRAFFNGAYDKIYLMRIVTVIPFSRNIHKDSLTYFTAKDIAVGAIVSVPVRKKLVDA